VNNRQQRKSFFSLCLHSYFWCSWRLRLYFLSFLMFKWARLNNYFFLFRRLCLYFKSFSAQQSLERCWKERWASRQVHLYSELEVIFVRFHYAFYFLLPIFLWIKKIWKLRLNNFARFSILIFLSFYCSTFVYRHRPRLSKFLFFLVIFAVSLGFETACLNSLICLPARFLLFVNKLWLNIVFYWLYLECTIFWYIFSFSKICFRTVH